VSFTQRIKTGLRDLRRRFSDPRKYVKTDETSGRLQFELLKQEGCQPSSRVLEVGCGCLHAGVHLMQYLNRGGYAGIDPNSWLINDAIKQPAIQRLVEAKQPQFLFRTDFDAGSLNQTFDYVLSHSVLSHAAHWQLEEYLRNTSKVLAPGGRIVASIRLAEGNAFGSKGSPTREDSMDKEWVYPGVSWFKLATVIATAEKLGLQARHAPEHTAYYTKTRPNEFHDWIVFSRKATAG
jgi:cyclopropane fatty-acyl-phospholipid synthase-like methyltransferase